MVISKKIASGLVGCALVAVVGSAQAATICVDDTAFTGGAPANCAATCDGTNNCDILDAVEKADADNTLDTVIFDPLVFPAGAGTTITTTFTLLLDTPVTIQGPGADSLIIDNDGNGFDVIEVDHDTGFSPSGPHTISGLRVTGGFRGIRLDDYDADVILDSLVIEGNDTGDSGGGAGGGVRVDNSNGATGTIKIQNCVITNNNAADNVGGGIEVEDNSMVEITNSFLFDNTTTDSGTDFDTENGGAVAVTGESTVTITDSIISNNNADDEGGGIFLDPGSTLSVTDSVISDNTTISANGGGIMIFNDNALLTTRATFTRTSIVRNATDNSGGGIAVDGGGTGDRTKTVVNITSSTIAANEAVGSDGGGINTVQATITVDGTTIDGNEASDEGGGIQNEVGGLLTITGSTISNNRCHTNDGGGIQNDGPATSLVVTNSTISGNRSEANGGGINNDPNTNNTVTLLNVTVTGNRADADFSGAGAGGGIHQESVAGAFTVTNSIIAGNFNANGSPDCGTEGTNVTSGGNNLIGSDLGCSNETFDASLNDQVGTVGSEIDPLLGPLTPANGGDPANGLATGIHEPQIGSKAIDGVDGTPAAPSNDQHDVLRPIGAAADIGAVEVGCGDGEVNLGEACDDGGESAACNTNCTTSACGDGVTNATAGETCDDTNTTAGDGCSDACKSETCGNKVLDSGEECEDGNAASGDGCSSTCQSESGTGGAGTDTDGDGVGDGVDPDDDNDGVLDADDNCPLEANADQLDNDGDGEGNVCEPASDGGGCSLIR